VMKFNAHGPEGLIDRKPPGHISRWTEQSASRGMVKIRLIVNDRINCQ
jgi:hypothetical protein